MGGKWVRAVLAGLQRLRAGLEPILAPVGVAAGSNATQPSYIVIFISAWLLLALRQPDRILHANFALEDGTIFFADAYNLTPIRAVTTLYAGYYHLIPRLFAEIASYAPLAVAPYLYSFSATSLSTLGITWFYLAQYRQLVRHDWLRLAVVLLILCAPNLEAFSVLAYVQWPLALWGILVVLMPWPANHWLSWALTAGYGLVLASAPVLVVLLPLWLIRLWLAQQAGQRLQIGLITVGQALLLNLLWQAVQAPGGASLQAALLIPDLLRAVSYKVLVVNVAGYAGGEWLLSRWGWPAVEVSALLTGLLLIMWLWSSRRRLLLLLLAYILCATLVLYIPRAAYYNYSFANAAQAPAPAILRLQARYFFLAGAIGYILVFTVFDERLTIWLARRRFQPHLLAWLTSYVVVLGLYAGTFRLPDWGDADWLAHARVLNALHAEQSGVAARLLSQTNADPAWAASLLPAHGYRLFLPLISSTPNAQTGFEPVRVPITPAGWSMTLFTPLQATAIYAFPAGMTLLAAQQDKEETSVGDELVFVLAWQPNPWYSNLVGMRYEAQVTVADAAQPAAAAADIPSVPVESVSGNVVLTRHKLRLPSSGRAPALRVSLRRRYNGQSIQVETILIKAANNDLIQSKIK